MSADKKLPSVFSAFLVNMSAKQSDPINPKTKLRHQVLNYCGYSSQMKNIFCGAENSDKIKHRHFSSVRVSAAGNLWMFIFKMFAVETVISPLLWTPSWIPLCFWFYCRGRLTDPGTYQYAAQILLFPVRGKKRSCYHLLLHMAAKLTEALQIKAHLCLPHQPELEDIDMPPTLNGFVTGVVCNVVLFVWLEEVSSTHRVAAL